MSKRTIKNEEAQIRVDWTEGSDEDLVELSGDLLQLVGGGIMRLADAIRLEPQRVQF